MILRNNKKVKALTTLFILEITGCSVLQLDLSPQEPIDPLEEAVQNIVREEQNKQHPVSVMQNQARQIRFQVQLKKALEAGEIIVGMKPEDVILVWGNPAEVQYAGDAQFGNEKWIYRTELNQFHSRKSSKIVHFQSHQVMGWEIHDPK